MRKGKPYTVETFEKFLLKFPIVKIIFSNKEIEEFLKIHAGGNEFRNHCWSLFNKTLINNGKRFSESGDEERFYNFKLKN